MNLRQRLLITFSLVVVIVVALVAYAVSLRTRSAFEQVDQERTGALVAQFRKEFESQGQDVVHKLERIARSEDIQRLALESAHGGEMSVYLQQAAATAQEYGLDFLQILDTNGNIISSAEWPARFGYRQNLPAEPPNDAFLKKIELPEGYALGLIALRTVRVGDALVYLEGGKRLDLQFLETLSLPPGMYAWLYRVNGPKFNPADVMGEPSSSAAGLAPLLNLAIQSGSEHSAIVQLSPMKLDRATVQAIPVKDDAGEVAAVLLAGTSRRPLLELQRNIRATAFIVAGVGILLGILISVWIAARFSRPIEQLAEASREVAGGNWDVQVQSDTDDELQDLADAFNAMTKELIEQRDRLVQTERVAAWRELARRLAHELKNPLFPLQLTVENLSRARALPAPEFEEIFNESSATLLAEIQNLKTIIARFSDFSKMPRPQLQPTSLNELVQKVATLHQAQVKESPKAIALKLELDRELRVIPLDPDLMHRVVSNLFLNAIDAMPKGGTLHLRTHDRGEYARLEISDTGIGLTPEERERIFTPYYTTKKHGTGLGLAVVQSIVSDHHGSISVVSEPGQGTTFIIDLPKRAAESDLASVRMGATV
ncbi:MAG TPA: HAMP domain-containing sensor histidine kinase [Terriglobales bacterium]|nr:HAMP domain-containing sensor histidine kinase [Terriglobales bacterium]